MFRKRILLTSFAILLPLSGNAAITQIVAFGDSLSDNGNAASVLPGGVFPGNYAAHALTNGPSTVPATNAPLGLWVDQLAAKLGVADPQPFVLGGTNYAVASASTGHNPAFTLGGPPTSVPYTSDQVALYLATHPAASPTSLYTFWAGANDINQSNPPTLATALANAVAAADNIKANIQALAAAGAKQFLWLNQPLLGESPLGKASGLSAALDAASNAFNAQWAADILTLQSQGIPVTGVNVGQLFTQIAGNPAQFGFTNITNPAGCFFAGSLAGCASNNPNQFLFWDGEHPTTAADAQIATFALNSLNASTSVPEPGTLGFAFAGLGIGFIAAAKRRTTR